MRPRAADPLTTLIRYSMRTVTLSHRAIVDHLNALAVLSLPAGIGQVKTARILATLRPEAVRITEGHDELLREYALRDDHGQPALVTDPRTGEPREGVYRPDPARRTEMRAAERALLDATLEIRVPFLTVAELEEMAKKKELAPGALSYLLTFVDYPPEPAADGGEA